MSTTYILVVFALCLVAMIFLIAKCKVHAVMSLLVVTIILGIAIGTPLGEVEGVINKGFADTIKSVGIVILLGCILGKLLEETGAAQAITKSAIKIVGKKNIIWAIGFSAFVLGIPIFSDTVTILLIPIVSNLALETGTSMMAFGSALVVGAQITHSLVPPTPGPVAAAALLGVPLGQAIGWGLVVSIPGLIASTLYCKFVLNKEMVLPKAEYMKSADGEQKKLPSTGMAYLPIVLPLILIVGNTVIGTAMPDTAIASFFAFIGSPMAALLTGCILALILTGSQWKSKLVLNDWVENAMQSAAMPVFVTGMGGALALFIKNAGVAEKLAEFVVSVNFPGLLVPMIISMLVHVVTGSNTLAVMTTAALAQPMLGILGISPLVAFLGASSAGMMFKHGNSSAFWVGTSLSNMNFMQGIKGIGGACTASSLVMCITTIILYVVGLI